MQTIINNPNQPIAIVCLNLLGEYVDRYKSINVAATKLNLDAAHIGGAISGKRLRVDNYLFIEAERYDKGIRITHASLKRKRDFLNKYKVTSKP